ncbi:MAG: nucleotidyltransferase domain-containing protein [Cloacibacillus porcorum]|uniref:nucleotidyltransferase domain-containing protein n=1 Tax=Cloacibacillus porcorum TaxID=1197717 RepID=UPI0023F04DEA|nr:nucleotidyltransferase domain-containing protein [Cloacibacillus porcorum]MCD7875965.1 nucleotidyltransferase domain-containing protein [Cloacibacillus porcorum]
MRELIEEKLREIEVTENVKVLYAVESGSRSWGFASPDSDYDVRFIYVRPRDFYLRLEKTRDVIEWQLDEVLDINGWDLQKALRLVHESNPTIFEWFMSGIVYERVPDFTSVVNELLNGSFYSCKAGFHHYLSMAKKNYREYLRVDEVKIKKYFYALRPILAARWIMNRYRVPPILFKDLVETQLDDSLKPIVNELIVKKMKTLEIGTGRRIDILNRYIEESIDELEAKSPNLPTDRDNSWAALNRIFLENMH